MLSIPVVQIQEYKAKTNAYRFCAHLCETQGLEEVFESMDTESEINLIKVRIKFETHV